MAMYISHIALNRMVEERAASDARFRRDLKRNQRPLLSHGRGMSDDELLAKLCQLGIDAQRKAIVDGFPKYVSAEEMSKAMIASGKTEIPDAKVDWVWIVLTCLWERWQPNLPNMEMVDDKMQAGYEALKTGDTLQACRLWLEAWRGILQIIERARIASLDAFDGCFGGTQSVFNWVQDLEMELHNAGLESPSFIHERISLCETMLDRFSDGKLPIDNFRAALGESHFELGDRQTGDNLFRVWLTELPQWGSGWITWSNCHWLFARAKDKDATRAEQILQEGLAVPGVENRRFMLERLQVLYEETGKDEEAESVRAEIRQARELENKTTVRSTPDSMSQRYDLDEEKLPPADLPDFAQPLQPGHAVDGGSTGGKRRVGRNEPCPCGSGKKFKKCCARKPR